MGEKKHRKHSKHSKHRKHRKHKKQRKGRSRAPVGMPSVPTLEQNQYWLLHGRIAALENQAMQGGTQRSGGEKTMSRSEEVDIANRVIDENLKRARDRDDARPPENALDKDDINFLKETRRQLQENDKLAQIKQENDKFEQFEREHGFAAGGDGTESEDEEQPSFDVSLDVSQLAHSEIGSMLVERERAHTTPPKSPPETQSVGARPVLKHEVLNSLTTLSRDGPTLADEFAFSSYSPVFQREENRPGAGFVERRQQRAQHTESGDRSLELIGQLQAKIRERDAELRTLSDTLSERDRRRGRKPKP